MTTFRWPEVLGAFLYVATFALVVTLVSQGQAFVVPIALAALLSFVLTPITKGLERIGLHRVIAVALVMIVTLIVVSTFGYLVTQQFNELASQMPRYSKAIRTKLETVRATSGAFTRFQDAVDSTIEELDQEVPAARSAPAAVKKKTPKPKPQPVEIVPQPPSDVERFWAMVEPAFEPITTAGIVLVLTIFMLMQREDLRNRFIRLVGRGRMTVTTRTMDEAGQRISDYLLTQTLINTGFGILVTAGLFLIGVPYAALWGVTAGLLRFVPYVGAFLALVMPTALAFVQFEGWGPTLLTVGMFLLLDVVTANVAEPLLVGHRTGVSSLALLVMALFWTWMWGPIGLLLSTPITVCLVVLGRHVPKLEFLSVLLGDAPPLDAEVTYYQRLIAGDDDEAGEIVEQQLEARGREQVFDDVLVAALVWAGRDRARQEITDAEHEFVVRASREIVHDLADRTAEEERAVAAEGGPEPAVVQPRQAKITGIPARGSEDVLVLDMMRQLFDPGTCEIEQVATPKVIPDLLSTWKLEKPDLILITALPPGGLTHARYLCKRSRAALPETPIVVLRPGASPDEGKSLQRLTAAGANTVAATLIDARAEIARLLGPILKGDGGPSQGAAAVAASTPAANPRDESTPERLSAIS